MERGGGGASRWHMLGFGTWPPFLPSMLQILEMVVGTAAVCGPLPGIAGPAAAQGPLLALALGSLRLTSCWWVWTAGARWVLPGHRSLASSWGDFETILCGCQGAPKAGLSSSPSAFSPSPQVSLKKKDEVGFNGVSRNQLL